MPKGLDDALELLLAHEGGWSNHPADRGGATMYGVTQATYDGWRAQQKARAQSVKLITKEEAREVYEGLYWKVAKCDLMPWPISYMVFDAAVNSGPSRAMQWLQQALGVTADGIWGTNTAAALKAANRPRLVRKIIDARVTFLARLVQQRPQQAAFLLGWWRRTNDVLAVGLTEK